MLISGKGLEYNTLEGLSFRMHISSGIASMDNWGGNIHIFMVCVIRKSLEIDCLYMSVYMNIWISPPPCPIIYASYATAYLFVACSTSWWKSKRWWWTSERRRGKNDPGTSIMTSLCNLQSFHHHWELPWNLRKMINIMKNSHQIWLKNILHTQVPKNYSKIYKFLSEIQIRKVCEQCTPKCPTQLLLHLIPPIWSSWK